MKREIIQSAMKKRTLSRSGLEVFAIEVGCIGLLLLLMLLLTSCIEVETVSSGGAKNKIIYGAENGNMENQTKRGHLITNDYVRDIVNHQAFKGFGELMLPWDDNTSYYNTPLNQVGSLMPYHSQVNADIVVGALNHMMDEANAGKTIFYDFYDWIANVSTVERRVENLRNAGVEVEYRRYRDAGHGFGLGVGTDAEGWIEYAIKFWESHLSK